MTPVADVDLAYAAASDVGLHREVNEDNALSESPVFVVADGIGGYEAGDRASLAVVSAFRSHLCGGETVDLQRVSTALVDAEQRVAALAATTQRGAGSTVTGLVLLEHSATPHWLVLNVGDSRVYRCYDAELEQLTVDHSLAQEFVDSGRLAEHERRTFEARNVITRAIGGRDSRADTWLMPVTTGERLLVCSDGLHSDVPDEEIRAILTMGGRPSSAASALIDAAKRSGGNDNITVIVIDVRAGGEEPGNEDWSSGSTADSTWSRSAADTRRSGPR